MCVINKSFVFFNNVGTKDAVSTRLAILNGDEFVFQVDGSETLDGLTLVIKGNVDRDSENDVAVMVLNLATNQYAASITGAGLYKVVVSGFDTLFAEITAITAGTIKVFGRLISK